MRVARWRTAAGRAAVVSALCCWPLEVRAANDPHLEDQVAALFIRLREEAGLPKLTRIKHSKELEQLTCTVAVEDGRRHLARAFKTSDPTTASGELWKYAAGPPYKRDWITTRFAVAVWPARKSGAGPQEYWVAVRKYLSPLAAFIDYTLTDDIGHQNDWKKVVNPSCKHVE